MPDNKIRVKVFIHAQYNEYEKSFTYQAHNMDMSDYGYTFLESQEVKIRQPTVEELTNKTVRALREKQKTVLAAAQSEYNRVQATIDTLLAIEHKG